MCRVNHWEKWMLIYVMDFDFSVTPNSVIWKYPVKWVYLNLFKVHYRSLNLCTYLWKTGLDWLRRCLLMKRNVNLLITTASHILSIPSDSPWGFFWGTWVQRSKKVGFFFFFDMSLPSFQIYRLLKQKHCDSLAESLKMDWSVLSSKSRILRSLKIP